MKWLWLIGLGVVLGAGPVAGCWYRAATKAADAADSANALHAAQLAHQQALADAADIAMVGANSVVDSLKILLRQRPPVHPAPRPPVDSTVPTLLAGMAARDRAIAERDSTLADRDTTIASAKRLTDRVADSLKTARLLLGGLRDSLKASPARPCPAPLEPPRIPGLSLELAAYTGAGISTTFAGRDPRLGWNTGVGLAAKIPLRKLVPRFLR